MRVKSSVMTRGLANARPPGSAKFANAPPSGLTRRANAPQLPGGGGAWAQVELTDALHFLNALDSKVALHVSGQRSRTLFS